MVGVLLSRHIFQDCLRGRSPYESLVMYHAFAKQEGLRVIFFTVEHLSMRHLVVNGFERMEKGRYVQKTLPIPRVIHNRIKPAVPTPELRQLQSHPYIHLFNQDNRLDKWDVHQVLVKDEKLKPHLPETHLLRQKSFEEMMEKYPSIYLKPRNKSLGMGVRKLQIADADIQITHAKGQKESIQPANKKKWMGQLLKKEPLLIQQSISLLQTGVCPIDIRVSVQRGRSGDWQVSGMVARVGPKYGIATNVAVGGRANQLLPTLKEAGLHKSEPILRKIEWLVLHAARRLAEFRPDLADLGFDIAIDQEQQIWIIEVNARDLRITFHNAKDLQAWQKTFATPMQYASYLIRHQISPVSNQPSVAIVTPGNLPVHANGSGSVEISAREIAREVAKQHQVYLVGKSIRSFDQVKPVEIKTNHRQSYLERTVNHLRFLGPDIIQIENRPLWVGQLNQMRTSAKKVLFLHSHTYIQPPYAKPAEVGKYLSQYDLILTNSQFMVQRLSQQFPGIARKLRAVRLGVDLDHFRSIHDEEVKQERIHHRRKQGLSGKPVILYVGRMMPKKGVHHLVDAFLRVHQEHTDAVLLIVGSSFYGKNIETPYVKNLKEKSKRLGSAIRWLPFTSHQQLPAIYQLADVLVTPSICQEAFGLVNVEGMASGLPILTTKTGGIPEVVEDGVNGRLLPIEGLTDRLVKVLNDWLQQPYLLKQMGRESRKRAEAYFSWERVGRDLSEIYQSLA